MEGRKSSHLTCLLFIQKYFIELLEKSLAVPQKVKRGLPYDLKIPLLSIYVKELEIGIQTNVCTQMFLAPLFTIAKSFPTQVSIEGLMVSKIWYIHTVVYYSGIKSKY